MSAFIRDNFRIFNVERFIDSFFDGSSENTLYIGVGRPYKWNATDVAPKDNNLYRNLATELEDMEDLMSLKKVTASTVSHSIKKIKWTPNQMYDEYRHDYGQRVHTSAYTGGTPARTLSEAYYYVVCDDNSIWICIKRPKVWTSLSTFSPVASTKSPIDPSTISVPGSVATANLYQTADGYIWKKIAVTDSADVVSFSSNDFHPVKTLKTAVTSGVYEEQWEDLQGNSVTHRGGIYSIDVTAQGAGYLSGTTSTFTILNASAGTEDIGGNGTQKVKVTGDGSGLTFRVVVVGGNVRDIEVLNPGSGYTFAKVEFVMAGSADAKASATAILTSPEGLGVNPVKDLNAYYLSIYASFSGAELGHFTTQNDYRKIVLLANPKIPGSFSSVYSEAHADCMYRLTLDVVPTIDQDQIIEMNNSKVRLQVVDVTDTGAGILARCLHTKASYASAVNFQAANQAISSLSGDNFTDSQNTQINVTDVDTQFPKINVGTGELLYSEYRQSVSRGDGITEQWKIVLEF